CLPTVTHFAAPLVGPTTPAEQGQAQCQSAEGVPLSDTCQTPHTPSGGANELQLSGASPVPVRWRCAFVGQLSNTSHSHWRCYRAPAERGKPSASPLKVCLCRTPVNQFTPPVEVLTSSSCSESAQCTVRCMCALLVHSS